MMPGTDDPSEVSAEKEPSESMTDSAQPNDSKAPNDKVNPPASAEDSLDTDLHTTNDAKQAENADESDDQPLNEVDQLQLDLAAAQTKAQDHWDRLVRLQAEMENQRKRAQNDLNKARKYALEGIVGDLLPVRDSLEMGLAAAKAEEADPNAIVEGADLTLKMLAQVFEKNNIVEINPVDEKFDPEFHQAMSMQEIDGKPANTVTSVMQKGYTLNERLVRPALVMVSK